ncbi:MAG: GNAT family N-acetyltransferase [Leadbetterella sp.]
MDEKADLIIDPITVQLLEAELTPERMIRRTNYLNNEIYVFNGNTAPNLMKEVGRLRELSFRMAGGGTGKSYDVDEFDLGPYAYSQLIVWDPEEKELVGGYRFKPCWEAKDQNGTYHLSTQEIFEYSKDILDNYFPKTIELGRSFVQPSYQATNNPRKGVYALDNLWDGLGALVVNYPVKYFFGKVTMYTHFSKEARDCILGFMHYFFPDKENLIHIPSRLKPETNIDSFLKKIEGLSYKEAHKLLSQTVRELGESVPPLFNAYMNLSPTMKTFGTSVNDHFGGVEETGIMVTIDDIYQEKIERYVNSIKS